MAGLGQAVGQAIDDLTDGRTGSRWFVGLLAAWLGWSGLDWTGLMMMPVVVVVVEAEEEGQQRKQLMKLAAAASAPFLGSQGQQNAFVPGAPGGEAGQRATTPESPDVSVMLSSPRCTRHKVSAERRGENELRVGSDRSQKSRGNLDSYSTCCSAPGEHAVFFSALPLLLSLAQPIDDGGLSLMSEGPPSLNERGSPMPMPCRTTSQVGVGSHRSRSTGAPTASSVVHFTVGPACLEEPVEHTAASSAVP